MFKRILLIVAVIIVVAACSANTAGNSLRVIPAPGQEAQITSEATDNVSTELPETPEPMEPPESQEAPDLLKPIITDMQETLLPSRPEHAGQLNIEDIKAGMILTEHHAIYVGYILIVKAPYYDIKNDCKFDYVRWENGHATGYPYHQAYCEDFGLQAYTGVLNGWNPENYLTYTGEKNLSETEINKIIEELNAKLKEELDNLRKTPYPPTYEEQQG